MQRRKRDDLEAQVFEVWNEIGHDVQDLDEEDQIEVLVDKCSHLNALEDAIRGAAHRVIYG